MGVTRSNRGPALRSWSDLAAAARQTFRGHADAVIVAFLASVGFVAGFGGGFGRLSSPLGMGDALTAYSSGNLWGQGAPFGNTTLGYPLGIELRYFPTGDVTQNAIAGILGAITGNPFLAMNLLFAASFPIAALLALWVIKMTGLRGPVPIVLSLAFTMIPFHWLRVEHVYLATLYSAVLAVGLAILVGTGRFAERLRSPHWFRARFPLVIIVAVIAASGIYYACFAILLSSVATLYRFARGSRIRAALIDLSAPASIALFLLLVLAPSILWEQSNPALHPVAGRLLIESVAYSGVLALAILPAPLSSVPGMDGINDWIAAQYSAVTPSGLGGVVVYSNGGSLFTLAALVFIAVGLVVRLRRKGRNSQPPKTEPRPEDPLALRLGLVGLLLGVGVLFFVPWGLNFLFAAGVTTQLRAWDRMLPLLFLLVFVAAAVVWRELRIPTAGRRVWIGFAVCLVLLGLDGAIPYRATFDDTFARVSVMTTAAEEYGAALNDAVPGECAVLTLPYVAYPESGPVVSMGVYEPYWLTFANPEKLWSYAAMRDTLASAWLASLGNNIDDEAIADLEAGGFCAVHVDRRGYTADDAGQMVGNLTSLLGTPVATGFDGQWLTFALPDDDVADLDVADVDALPDPLQVFYYPPDIERAGTLPEVDAFDRWWWIDAVAADFTVTSIVDNADFTTVSGELTAADCARREVVATLTSGSQTATTTVRLGQGESRAFALELDQPTDSAVLTVTTDGPTCTDDESTPPRSVALYNPTAAY